MCSMKILATTGEIQDPIGAPKLCRYKVLLKEKTVEWRLSSTHFMPSLAVTFERSCTKLSDMISKFEIIDKVSGTKVDINKLTTSKEIRRSSLKHGKFLIYHTNLLEF